MIVFKTIRWKNLLSTGNIFTEINLNTHATTLIVGENGAGKSTLLDALTFALFGKPYRNINKPTLINSINTKECLVELEFAIGNKDYKIRRGIKPNVFEIHVNGKLLDQDAKAKDYQDMLERMILKMSYKSFTQIVILGSSSFVPFMQLSAADRRAVIEDLLDIQIFSTMNTLVKTKLSTIKEELNEVRIRLESVQEKIKLHKKHIDDMKRNNDETIQAKEKQIEDTKHTLVEEETNLIVLNNKVNDLLKEITEESSLNKKHGSLVTLGAKIENNISKVEKEILFYETNDNCPTCRQTISTELKKERIEECAGKKSTMEEGYEKLQQEKNTVIEKLQRISKINATINAIGKDIANTNSAISHSRKYIALLEQEIDKLKKSRVISTSTEEQSKQLVEELTGYIEKRNSLNEQKSYYDVASAMLKDGGIKTRIIRQYLPVINKMVNKYLAGLDFFVNFTIDEEFKETIKSRHRDEFSYENFSEGEKQKIDLALLFTWRAVARLKNSVNTNLLILDETFDSSMDSKGTDSLLQILHSLPENTNVFVISHKDQLHDKFNNSIRFEKKQGFSRIAA